MIRTRMLSVRVTPEVEEALRKAASLDRRTVSNVIQVAIDYYLLEKIPGVLDPRSRIRLVKE